MKHEAGKYTPPAFRENAFHCPHCNVFSHQYWSVAQFVPKSRHDSRRIVVPANIPGLSVAHCEHCKKYSLWEHGAIVYPPHTRAPVATEDMPASVRKYYDEARSIASRSPRSAAALLRLAAKKLCEELGEHEQNLYCAIGNLEKRNLPKEVIQSLDTVRIVGNEAGAHEGQIDLTDKDNEDVVDRLFKLVNIIVEKTITEPNYIKETFGLLPEDKRKAIANRDNS